MGQPGVGESAGEAGCGRCPDGASVEFGQSGATGVRETYNAYGCSSEKDVAPELPCRWVSVRPESRVAATAHAGLPAGLRWS